VVRAAIRETTAYGAGLLAGLGVGLWRGLSELANHWRADRVFEPSMPAEPRFRLIEGWSRAVERSRDWAS
jgi:glycerol kinase